MSSRKRGLGNDSHSVVDIGPKRSKDNDQLPRETDSFCFVDDVITDLRSIEGYVGQVKSDDFRKVVDKLEKSDILVRKKQGQDEPEHHVIYKEDITELRRLIDKHCAKTGSGKFEKLIQKIISEDRLITRQTSHREDSNRESENADLRQHQEPFQEELHSSQAVVKPETTISADDDVIEMKPDMQNLRSGGEGFVAAFFETIEPSPVEFSNTLKNVALINFNVQLLVKLSQSLLAEKHIRKVCALVKQRITLIKSTRYECTLAEQQKFNQDIRRTLLMFIKEVSPKNGTPPWIHNVNTIIQELVGIPSDATNTAQSIWPYCKYLSDFDLLKCIMNNSDCEAAQHVLCARKLRLKRLCFGSKAGVMGLNLTDSDLGDDSFGISDPLYRIFEYGLDVNKVDAVHIFGLLNNILQFYDISNASIILRSNGSTSCINYQLLESRFGAPPTDQNGKIRTREITLESPEMVDFLRWVCPTRLMIDCDPGVLASRPSLVSGVNVVDCKKMDVDRLMENCTNEVLVHCKATWSEASIRRVLTAHRLSADGCRRKITCICSWISPVTGSAINTVKGWRKLFQSWRQDFAAKYGKKVGRKVTMSDNNIDFVTLMLH